MFVLICQSPIYNNGEETQAYTGHPVLRDDFSAQQAE